MFPQSCKHNVENIHVCVTVQQYLDHYSVLFGISTNNQYCARVQNCWSMNNWKSVFCTICTILTINIGTPYLHTILVLNLKWSILLPVDVSKILQHLIWVYTVCKGISVPTLTVITLHYNDLKKCHFNPHTWSQSTPWPNLSLSLTFN